MSNEFVMVPRELLDKWETCLLAHDLHGIADEVRAILAQHQGEPVAWRGINELGEVVTDWIDGTPPESMVDLCGNSGSYDKIELAYTHADTGEVKQLSQIISNLNEERDELGAEVGRLREGIGKHWEVVCDQMAELDALHAQLAETQRISQEEEELRANRYSQQLAERDALLRRWVVYGQAELHTGVTIAQHLVADTKGALSASAEPVDECAHSHSNKFGCPECGEEFIRTNERGERAGKDLYTCDGKGGMYELLGLATGAGIASGEDRLIYRDATTRRLFLRTEPDFSARMKKIGEFSAEPSAPKCREVARQIVWHDKAQFVMSQLLGTDVRCNPNKTYTFSLYDSDGAPVERDERAMIELALSEYGKATGNHVLPGGFNEKQDSFVQGFMSRADLERKP